MGWAIELAMWRDPFTSSVMARSAWSRVAFVTLAIGALWLAVAWAVALP